ncbi:DUF6283 family protein [Photobacterium leiognathi]|uniref:DUF6283 family protein n=1 Tax=Photobacterium leiognathi TaxID=553611 RepID=UPI002982722E|nr:DUF6283 family protein [Photobacterium leiognathi]
MKNKFCKTPCKQCPWKKSSKVGGSDIPNFDIELMRNLVNTCPPANVDISQRDDFRKLFACHESPEGKEKVCAGYVARDGQFNLNLRLLAAMSKTNVLAIVENAEKHELYDNFHDMLTDYENHLTTTIKK